jgi:hypothetical protein
LDRLNKGGIMSKNIIKYRNIINKKASKYYNIYKSKYNYLEYNDFVQLGNLFFLKIKRNYNQDKSLFITYLYNYLDFYFSHHFQNKKLKEQLMEDTMEIKTRTHNNSDLKMDINLLSKDSKLVFRLCENGYMSDDTMQKAKDKISISRITKKMKERYNWKKKRIENCMNELKTLWDSYKYV